MNSLSAATYQDFLVKLFPRLANLSDRQQVRLSRWLTILWGAVATVFALEMIGGSETVLELVNKIGSAFYGPILATFWLGMLTRRTNQIGAIVGLISGVAVNIFLWQFYGARVSWLWWNVIGFAVSFLLGYGVSHLSTGAALPSTDEYAFTARDFRQYLTDKKFYVILFAVFAGIILFSYLLQEYLFALAIR